MTEKQLAVLRDTTTSTVELDLINELLRLRTGISEAVLALSGTGVTSQLVCRTVQRHLKGLVAK